MAHIIIICTGNVCRSPVGEALLRDRLHKRGLTDWRVSSAGTWAKWVREASQHSVYLMSQTGHDITAHRSRMVDEDILSEADLVLCMETGHVEALHVEFPAYADKIFTLSEMSGERYSVYDPYGESLEIYQRMVAELTELVDSGLERIIELANQQLS